MKSLRTLQIAVEASATKARICSVEHCDRSTREGKDFCTNHVTLHPYVRSLIKRIENKRKEDELVQKEGSSAVNLEGITVNEILLCLRQGGTKTEEHLIKNIQLPRTINHNPRTIIHNYLIRLSMEGYITFGRTSRDKISVSLVDHDPSTEIDEDEP